jgi:F-box domain.
MFQRSLEPDLEQGLGKEIIASERPNVQGFIVNTKSVEHRQPCQLLDLPFDNVLLIIEHLNFDDILRLRAVCPQLQAFFNPKLLSYVMGQALFAQERDRYCGICFRKAPDDNFTNCRTPTFLLKPNEASDEWWCICVDCGFKKKRPPTSDARAHVYSVGWIARQRCLEMLYLRRYRVLHSGYPGVGGPRLADTSQLLFEMGALV